MFQRRRVHMEQLMNHGNLLVSLTLDQRPERKQWVVSHTVECSRSCHGLGASTSIRPGTSFVGGQFKSEGQVKLWLLLFKAGTLVRNSYSSPYMNLFNFFVEKEERPGFNFSLALLTSFLSFHQQNFILFFWKLPSS